MKKKFSILIFIFTIFASLVLYSSVRAICPVCTIAVCFGVGLSRWLKIDDSISGLWIGGLIISLILWFLNWLNKKQINFKFKKILVTILFYLIIVAPLYFSDIMGNPLNKFLGIDKLLFGIIAGSLVFLISVLLHNLLKKKNQGKSFFPFQKVVLPILFLAITSLIFYIIIC